MIASISTGVPKALTEITTLGRTLAKRSADVLAYFDRPGTSNGPTEAINGRLEHLRGSALGFRNLTNYIARSLLETTRWGVDRIALACGFGSAVTLRQNFVSAYATTPSAYRRSFALREAGGESR